MLTNFKSKVRWPFLALFVYIRERSEIMENRPRGRDRNIDGEGKGIFRRGDGLGTGPVGSQGSPSGGSGGPRRGMGGGKGPISIIALLILLLFGGKQSGILNTLLQITLFWLAKDALLKSY